MKSIEEISKEYEEYNVSEEVKETILDPYLLVMNIENVVRELEETESFIQRRKIRDNLIALFNTSILLKEKEDCWKSIISITEEIINYLVEIANIVDEKNYVELTKLVDFMIYNYEKNMAYFNSRLKSIDAARRGITMVDYGKENTHPQLMKLVEMKINKLKTAKELEKKSKI